MSLNTTIKVSAPGKVILHGEHSVVYGKLALAASLGLRTRLQLSEGEGDRVKVEFEPLQLACSYDVKDFQSLLAHHLPLTKPTSSYNISHPELLNFEDLHSMITTFIKGKSYHDTLDGKQLQAVTAFFCLLYGIFATFDVELCPFKVKTTTDLAVSAGTGSSASFSVAAAASLIQYVKVKQYKVKNVYKNFEFSSSKLDEFDKDELDLISKWAFLAEKVIHGTPSGVDNTVCTYGAMVEFYKGTTPKHIDLITKFKIILINTNIPRDTKAQVEKVSKMRSKHEKMVDGILTLMDEVAQSALDYVKKINKCMGDEFVAVQYYDMLGELAEINHNLLRCLNVSHPKLEEACQMLQKNGLKGKLTGAGGGGFAIALIPPHFQRADVKVVLEQLNSRGFSAVMTDLGGSGVTID